MPSKGCLNSKKMGGDIPLWILFEFPSPVPDSSFEGSEPPDRFDLQDMTREIEN